MDRQQILEAITQALDALEAEPEHLVLDYDLRSVRTADFTAEINVKDGKLAFFGFMSQAEKEAQRRASAARERLHGD